MIPADVQTVARFLVNLAKDCAFSTCNNYLSAIITLHKFFGYERPFREYFIIHMVMKGLGRYLGKEVNQKTGLNPTQLVDIYDKSSLTLM